MPPSPGASAAELAQAQAQAQALQQENEALRSMLNHAESSQQQVDGMENSVRQLAESVGSLALQQELLAPRAAEAGVVLRGAAGKSREKRKAGKQRAPRAPASNASSLDAKISAEVAERLRALFKV